MNNPEQSNNDPTPHARPDDAPFAPVVIAFAVAIVVILVAAIIFIKTRQTKAIPNPKDPHPNSQVIPYTPQPNSTAYIVV